MNSNNGTGNAYVDLLLRLLREVGFQGVLTIGLLYGCWHVAQNLVAAHAKFLDSMQMGVAAQTRSIEQIAESMKSQEKLLQTIVHELRREQPGR